MKKIAITLTLLALAGCNHSNYYRPGDPNFHKGESFAIYPYAPEDIKSVYAEGVNCWQESNRANWDQCY